MKLFAWIPGILGSRLERRSDGAEIWPPSPTAVDGLADRTFAELSDDLVATKVIDSVCIVPVYSPLDQLFVRAGVTDYSPDQPSALARLPFGYDWRLDIESQADILADRLDAICNAGDEIVFVAHSMGNYLARYLLETAQYSGRKFRPLAKKLVSINGPHAGAPVILARMMGLDKMDHIVWADVPRLLATPPFAAPAELLPKPGRNALFNEQTPIDIYDPGVIDHFGWGAENIARARQFWSALGAETRAQGVEYVIVRSYLDADGQGASTIADVRWSGGAWVVEKGPGDGSVPPWSAEALGPADVVLPGEHLGVIDTARFGAEVFAPHIAPFVEAEFLALTPSLKLQPIRRDVPAGGPAAFALVQDAADRVESFDGVAIWLPLTPAGALQLTQKPLKTPLHLDHLRDATVFQLNSPAQPGPYRVVLQRSGDGTPLANAPNAIVVAVAPTPPAAPPRPAR